MKRFALSIVLSIACCIAMAQEILPAERATAARDKKMILINFSGSDWCIPCIKMQRDFFENTFFQGMADSQLVIIHADFPRKKKNMPPPELVKRNEQLAELFNQSGSFPLTLLLNADLKVIKKWEGLPETSAEEFSKNINAIVNEHKN